MTGRTSILEFVSNAGDLPGLDLTSFPNKGQGQTMPCSSPWPYCTLPFTWHILDEIPESFQTFCYFKYLWKKCSILSNGITDRLS